MACSAEFTDTDESIHGETDWWQNHFQIKQNETGVIFLPFFSCRYVLEELIETEKMYVADLGLIVEVSFNMKNDTGKKCK